MKLLLTILSGCVLLTSSFLLAEPTRTECNCVNCNCTIESNCGCLSGKGCQCDTQDCQCCENGQAGLSFEYIACDNCK